MTDFVHHQAKIGVDYAKGREARLKHHSIARPTEMRQFRRRRTIADVYTSKLLAIGGPSCGNRLLSFCALGKNALGSCCTFAASERAIDPPITITSLRCCSASPFRSLARVCASSTRFRWRRRRRSPWHMDTIAVVTHAQSHPDQTCALASVARRRYCVVVVVVGNAEICVWK